MLSLGSLSRAGYDTQSSSQSARFDDRILGISDLIVQLTLPYNALV